MAATWSSARKCIFTTNVRTLLKLYQYPATSNPYLIRSLSSVSKEFTEAQAKIKQLTEDPGNESKLKMYALYKQATVGQVNIKKPGMLDLVGKAKWEAWKELGDMPQDVAQTKYIDHVAKLVDVNKMEVSSAPTSTTGRFPGLTITTDNGLRIIKFDRPDKKNAITGEMYQGMVVVLDEAAKDDSVIITVVTGVGEYYCSGNDLSNFTKAPVGNPEQLKQFSKEVGIMLEKFVSAFIDFPKPLVAVVNGPAIGISVTVLGLFDAVYASDKATFHTPFSALGQSPEGCSSYIFPKIMGQAKATEFLLFNKKFTAHDAQKMNLVTEVFPDAELEKEIWPRLKILAKLPVLSMIYSKQLTRQFEKDLLHKVNSAECERLIERWVSVDCMQAIQKFFMRKAK